MHHRFALEEVIECKEVGERIFHLTITWEQNAPLEIGQFVALKPKVGVMPRPFSVVSYINDEVTLLIKVVGENTDYYSSLKVGELVEVAGPIGSPFPFLPERKRVILVGGGIGAAALVRLFTEFNRKAKSLVVLLGASYESQLFPEYFNDEIAEVQTITADRGMVTDLLESWLAIDGGRSLVVACGPLAMLSKIACMCVVSGNPCQVIMEEMMACGTGACKGCAIFGKDGTVQHVCQDGPAFDANWIDWSLFQERITVLALPTSKQKENPLEVVLKGQNGNKLVLSSPLMPASGCFDVNDDGPTADIRHAGALVSKGIKLKAVSGNSAPRVCEVPGGMLNSIGLENIGIDRFIAERLPLWLTTGLPVIVNICGSTIEEYFELADRLADTPIAGVEVNVSCPNVNEGCIAFGVSSLSIARITRGVRDRLPGRIFVAVKHTPRAWGDIVVMARAARDGGADFNCLVNTFLACAIDIWTRKFKLGAGSGGYSGPGILPMAVELVRQVAAADLGIPIIGCGGVTDPDSATQMILAGASVVQIGTGLFAQPDLMTEIYQFWERRYLPGQEVNSIQDLIGKGGK
jgi:dihydroorotate dehydrogenase (NAD+) catalytic subunit